MKNEPLLYLKLGCVENKAYCYCYASWSNWAYVLGILRRSTTKEGLDVGTKKLIVLLLTKVCRPLAMSLCKCILVFCRRFVLSGSPSEALQLAIQIQHHYYFVVRNYKEHCFCIEKALLVVVLMTGVVTQE